MDPVQTAGVSHHLNWIHKAELGLNFVYSLKLFFKYSALIVT